jgi:SPP1 gp7 family putative phage head morphogenesis protein
MAGVLFQEAIDYLTKRLALTPNAFNELAQSLDAAASDRAAGMSDAMVRGILSAIEAALREGTTADTFRATFDELAKAQGWKGDNTEGWRSKLTFRVLTSQAMAAGRWTQIQRLKSTRPYLRYVTAGDHRVRDAHRQWHNVVLHADDPWWSTHFPPNGFNCRCHVQQLSERDLKRYGWEVTPQAPAIETVIKYVRRPDGGQKAVEVPKGIDPGFAHNPGELGLMLDAGFENEAK